ncbi:flagellar assembly protein FliW [Paenibacillus sedimenti]|uniref:Flagellar assembly factor FliW n=1 Tax=Paenibacillus sedimenti TaxID=2770274 RepID=A0A926KUC1_9BACL|nr:flagellar assembly protein FliW [Paenibacillus sedimenti]MBD0384180.1 flagellar assembly protein FliW [Paenibacillus sedimenti]
MVKQETLHFGEIEIQEDQIIHFPSGMPGFEDYSRFVLLHLDDEIPFSYLQSVDDGNISFIIANPFTFYPEYEFELSQIAKDELDIKSEEDVMVFGIITVHQQSGDGEITMNLLAPIVMNPKLRKAKQVVLHDTAYKTKHKLTVLQDEGNVREGEPSC